MTADYKHIMEGCRRHDRKAQQALYEAMAPMAMGVCMRYSSDRDEAQDLMQDGFVKVFEKIGRVREPEHLAAWIYRVMFSVCMKNYRRKVRRKTAEMAVVEPEMRCSEVNVRALYSRARMEMRNLLKMK